MKMTFRWYGSNSDSVTLSQIRQIPGMTGLMGFLDYKAAGEVWTEEEIKAYIPASSRRIPLTMKLLIKSTTPTTI